jgi:hypothetical protein
MKIPSALIGFAFFVAVTAGTAWTVAAEETIEVWKSPTCGCCNGWVDHLRENGLEVVTNDVGDLSLIKRMAGVPDHLQSCHTAKVGGYVIEGHVPASAVERLLEERPGVAGLAVPGMPAGSPGMPSPTPERYQVLTFGDGEPEAFATFVGPDEE